MTHIDISLPQGDEVNNQGTVLVDAFKSAIDCISRGATMIAAPQ